MRSLAAIAATASITLGGLSSVAAADVRLPPETAALKSSTLPGYAVAQQKCGICHSADYVDYQPPGMTVKQWTAEMTKMQHAYGAPISDDEVKLLGVYLTATYGDAKSLIEADLALKPAAVAAATPADASKQAPDVQGLLAANGCLACHATDKVVFGPAYHDVAVNFKADPQAVMNVAASIRQGGSGKWGTAAMPAFTALREDDARALAVYVLGQ